MQPHTHRVRVESADEFWHVMTRAGAPFVLLRERLGADEWKRQSRLARAYLAEQIAGPSEYATTAYLGVGRR